MKKQIWVMKWLLILVPVISILISIGTILSELKLPGVKEKVTIPVNSTVF